MCQLVPMIRPDSSHGFTQSIFFGEPVFRPLLLPNGFDAALRLFPQHPASQKRYLGGNSLAQEVRVTFSSVRYWDGKQWSARLAEIPRTRTTVEKESFG